jgi:hypothetical protein
MKEDPAVGKPRKKPFVKPELRAVRFEPREVALGSCKTPTGNGAGPNPCRLCGSAIGS